MKKIQIVGLSIAVFVLAGIAWLFLRPQPPTAVFTNCMTSAKDTYLHTRSNTQDRMKFSSSDDYYQAIFSSTSPFSTPVVDFDKQHPKTLVMTDAVRNQCDSCTAPGGCPICYFAFKAKDVSNPSKNDPATGYCRDPGVHIIR